MVIKVLQRRTKKKQPSLIPTASTLLSTGLVMGDTRGVEKLFERMGLGRHLHSKHNRREPDFKKTFLSV